MKISLGSFAIHRIAVVTKEASITSDCQDHEKPNPRHLLLGKICFQATSRQVWPVFILEGLTLDYKTSNKHTVKKNCSYFLKCLFHVGL